MDAPSECSLAALLPGLLHSFRSKAAVGWELLIGIMARERLVQPGD